MQMFRDRIMSQNTNVGPVIAPAVGLSPEMNAVMMQAIFDSIQAGEDFPVDFVVPTGDDIAAAEAAAEAAICL